MFLHLFFKNIVFKSVALVTNKLWAIFDFFSQIELFSPSTLSYKLKRIFFDKKSFKLLLLKVTKFQSDSVKNESTKKKLQGRQTYLPYPF